MRNLRILAVVILLLFAASAIAAPAHAAYEAPVMGATTMEAGMMDATATMGTMGARLYATQSSSPTVGLDTEILMEGINQGVEYGFSFATGFIPLVVVMVGFAVAGGVLGLLFRMGPQIARMIRNAF